MKPYPSWIDQYAKSVYNLAITADPKTHLPFSGFDLYPLYEDIWIDKVYRLIRKFNASGLSIKEIIKVLPTHSSIRFILLKLIIGFNNQKTDKNVVKTIMDFFLKAIKQRSVRDLFAAEVNLIHTPEEINKILSNIKLIKADRELAREIGKINFGAASLVYGLYNDFCTDAGYEVLGPYDVSKQFGDGMILIIREFPDLKVEEIWPEMKEFRCKSIKVFTVYKNIKCRMRYIGCHADYSGNLIENLIYFAILIDRKFYTSLEDLKEIRDTLLKKASEHYIRYNKFSFEEHKRIYLWQECFQLKRFFERMGMDWKPIKEMLERVKGKELVTTFTTYQIPFDEFKEKVGINNLIKVYS